MARKKTSKKFIPVSRRSGPKARVAGKLRCKYGVAKTGKRAGNCLKTKRCRKKR